MPLFHLHGITQTQTYKYTCTHSLMGYVYDRVYVLMMMCWFKFNNVHFGYLCFSLSLSTFYHVFNILLYFLRVYVCRPRVKFQYEEGINDTSGNHIHWKWEHILVNERMNESANWIYIERFDFFYDLYQKKKKRNEGKKYAKVSC